MVNIKTPDAPRRSVRCYHCGLSCLVSAHALSSSCSHCHRQLAIADIVVRARHWGTKLQTCGRIVLEPKADVRVGTLTAGAGVEVQGSFKGSIVSYGPVTLGETARVDGDLRAPAIFVSPGAIILGGSFSIAPNRG